MSKTYIQEAYDSVAVFNTVAGNLDKGRVSLASADAQLTFIFEELSETIDASEARDLTGMLDGACDMFVTVAGYLQKLEALGFDVKRALARVNENNLSKFPQTLSDENRKAAIASGFRIGFHSDYARYVLKDAAGKVRKPADFVAVKLNDLVPKEVE